MPQPSLQPARRVVVAPPEHRRIVEERYSIQSSSRDLDVVSVPEHQVKALDRAAARFELERAGDWHLSCILLPSGSSINHVNLSLLT